MNKHKKLLENKFQHSQEDLLYNTGGGVMWSLFKTKSGGVTIYYHETNEFHIIKGDSAKNYTLREIAENWNPFKKEITL